MGIRSKTDGFGGSTSRGLTKTLSSDVTSLSLSIASLEAQFGWNELDYSTNQRYLRVYTYNQGTNTVSTWRPFNGNSVCWPVSIPRRSGLQHNPAHKCGPFPTASP